MRYFIICLIALFTQLAAADLPSSIERAHAKYSEAVNKAHLELMKVYAKEEVKAMKAGNLDLALAIRALKDEQSGHADAEGIGDTGLTLKDLQGDWTLRWSDGSVYHMTIKRKSATFTGVTNSRGSHTQKTYKGEIDGQSWHWTHSAAGKLTYTIKSEKDELRVTKSKGDQVISIAVMARKAVE